MKLEWKKLLVKTTIWLAAEIILNLLGLDTLADYSEFLYEHEVATLSHLHQPAIGTVELTKERQKAEGRGLLCKPSSVGTSNLSTERELIVQAPTLTLVQWLV